MLEPVALNQTRFHVPGIAPDTRGVILGKQGALLFPAVDKLVSFLSILSDELSLDDLTPTLKLVEIRTPLRSREFLVLLHATSSYLLDRAARIARLLGGLAFTGSGKHFVKYRDEASPLGYDIDQLSPETADFLLYDAAFTQACTRVREVAFQKLAFRLSLRRVPGGPAAIAREADRDLLWLTVERGLARSVITYLWRNRVAVSATLVEREGPAGTFGQGGGYLLARVVDLPERMLALFRCVPGIEVHRPLGENVVVELGYRHPLRLESCQSLFEKERFYVFSGRRDTVDVIAGPPVLTAGERLVAVRFDLAPDDDGRAPRKPALRAERAETLAVALRLVPTETPPRRVTATLVPWERAGWLKKLVFTVPPTVLTGYRAAAVDAGLLIRGEQGVDGLPIGELFQEAAPSIYVPIGLEFSPRVSEAVLTDHVGGVAGRCVVFRVGEEEPLVVGEEAFEPLGRRMLGRLEVELPVRPSRLAAAPPPIEATVENDPVGVLPLWGFRALPPPDVEP